MRNYTHVFLYTCVTIIKMNNMNLNLNTVFIDKKEKKMNEKYIRKKEKKYMK